MINATPFLRLFARYRAAQLDHQSGGRALAATQLAQLHHLLDQAQNTQFGSDHGFSSIRSVEEYQKRVPLRFYEEMWTQYWKPSFPKLENVSWPGLIKYFCVSSGTSSGTTKYIPLTKEMLASNQKAGVDLLVHHVRNTPQSQIFGGRSFMLGGSTELVQQAPDIYSGDLSGITVKELPWWASMRYFPPAEIALLKNWEEKIAILAQRSLTENIRMISGVPSWMLIFFGKIAEITGGKSIAEVYPDLAMITHGGVNFAPYQKQFKDLLSGSRAELREVYPASEGFIAVADKGYGEGLRLMVDHGIFYEFVPLEELNSKNPVRHWAGNVELDVNYAVVLTTCAGLWSYVIGDTVRFVDKEPLRLLVTGRTSYYLSAFGEHLIAEEIEDAVSGAANSLNLTVTDYSVGPVYPQEAGQLGGHLYVVEFANNTPGREELNKLADEIDKILCKRNEDYEAHRAKGYGLMAPEIKAVQPGYFAAWMKSRGKLGGQNKVPRIITNSELFQSLVNFDQ
jgi:hypothetical protein